MTQSFTVSIDNEEKNSEAISITGRVNGTQCAAVMRLSSVAGLTAAKAKKAKQVALVTAYLEKTVNPVDMQGETVTI